MARELDPALSLVSMRLFVAVCEEGNIARAAAREAIVASAVSKRITAIEAAIGAPLLVRGRRGIEPTAAGQALLRQAREMLGAVERMHAELSEFASGVHGNVRMLAAPSVLAEALPDDIGSFLQQYPGVRVSVDERVSPDIVRGVREGSADLGVLWDCSALDGLHCRPYRSDHLCVALPRGHALGRRRQLRFEQTLDQVSVGVAPGGMMDLMLRRQAALLGRTPAHRIQVSSLDTACRVVAAGLGIAILPREAAMPHAAASGLVLVPLAEEWAERRFVVCSRAEAGLPASARRLAGHLVSVAAS